MPLSEEEQRALDEIERALVADDPRLASTIEGGRARRSIRLALPMLGLLCGITIVVISLVGADAPHTLLAVGGWALIVVSSASAASLYHCPKRLKDLRRFRPHHD